MKWLYGRNRTAELSDMYYVHSLVWVLLLDALRLLLRNVSILCEISYYCRIFLNEAVTCAMAIQMTR